MALTVYNFEGNGTGPSDGTALSTGNTLATTLSTAGGGSATFRTAAANTGTFGGRFVSAASNIAIARFAPDAPNLQMVYSLNFTLPTSVGAEHRITSLRHSSGVACSMVQSSGGTSLFIRDTANSGSLTLATGLTVGTKYRVEIVLTVATSTTGQISASLYAGNTTTQIGTTVTSSAFNLGTAAIAAADVGVVAALASAVTQDVDDVRFLAGGTAELGPVANVPPTITAISPNQNVSAGATVNLTSTASDVDGTIASRLWSFDFPTSGAPSFTGGTSANSSFTAGSAGSLYVPRITATDNGGATGFATTEVRVPATGTLVPLAMAATKVGTWTNVGGAATEGGAVADASDSTYLESSTATVTEQKARVRLQPSGVRSSGTITVRLAQDTAGTLTVKVRLFEGTTMRQEWTVATTTSIANTALTVTSPGAISDWGNLWLEFSVVG